MFTAVYVSSDHQTALDLGSKMHLHWLLMLLYLLLSWTTTAEQIYVVPSSNASCPRDPCYTLTDVVLNPSQYFASNTVMTFLSGNHQTNITRNLLVEIKDARNISMIGYDHSKSVIQCTGSLGFAFINVTTLKITKLSFGFCGARISSQFVVNKRVQNNSLLPENN